MHAPEASATPSKEPVKVNTYVVVPPRTAAFAGKDWLPKLEAHLADRFPDLVMRVSLLDALREMFEPVVMPVMGTANTGIPGRIAPMTEKIERTKDDIAAAVLAFDPDAPARRLN